MAKPQPPSQNDSAQVKLVAVVLVGTMGLWLLAQEVGREYNLAPRYGLLFDLIAMAGFVFALIVTYRIWRRRQQ